MPEVRSDHKAEQAVLGSILIDGGGATFRVSAAILNSEMFFDPYHQKLFRIMSEMHKSGTVMDMVTMERCLRDCKSWADDGQKCLCDLMDAVGHSYAIGYYSEIVARMFYEREILKACRAAAEKPEIETKKTASWLKGNASSWWTT